ncbi:Uncharacterised protein [Paenibacillus thiaminolyticus]|nr:Uncharacterised protein [Paenibacillus thiaminolyticus]
MTGGSLANPRIPRAFPCPLGMNHLIQLIGCDIHGLLCCFFGKERRAQTRQVVNSPKGWWHWETALVDQTHFLQK